MPAPLGVIPPGGIPGNTGGSNTYPQWGLKPSTGSIVQATSASQKTAYLMQGYVEWFTSQAAAQSAQAAQSNPFTSGGGTLPNPLAGINAIGDFFQRLTQGSTWTRVAEFLGGGLLLYIGVKSLSTPGGQKVARASLRNNLTKLAGKTPAGRTARTLGKARP